MGKNIDPYIHQLVPHLLCCKPRQIIVTGISNAVSIKVPPEDDLHVSHTIKHRQKSPRVPSDWLRTLFMSTPVFVAHRDGTFEVEI
jgi:hypothetical protein